MEYLGNGYSKNYSPRRDSTTISNRHTERETNLANVVYLDDLGDLNRWCKNSRSEITDYVTNKILQEMAIDEEQMNYYKDVSSDQRGFLVDMRKGMDWFKKRYEKTPKVLSNFYLYITERNDRLLRIKKYLSTRVRKFTALNYINDTEHSLEKTKFLQMFIKHELKALDIFLSKHRRFVERKTMEQILNGKEE